MKHFEANLTNIKYPNESSTWHVKGIIKGHNGYFKFDETFFEGIASANNYKIIFSSYVITTGEKTENGSYYQFHI